MKYLLKSYNLDLIYNPSLYDQFYIYINKFDVIINSFLIIYLSGDR